MKNLITRRRALIAVGAAATVSLTAGLTFETRDKVAAAQEKHLAPVRVFSFPGSLNMLVWIAQEKGFFASQGLDVSLDYTRTSMEMAEKLVSGQYDIATSSIDNVIAYNSGQGQIALSQTPDFFGFMNVSKNMILPLIVQDDIKKPADLKGKKLAVDAVSTGFSFVLRKILEQNGLGMEDYELVSVGNASERLAALKDNKLAGAILTPPFNRMAMTSGMRELGSSQDITDNYQGTCFISTTGWAEKNPNQLISFIRAILVTEKWLSNMENHLQAASILHSKNNAMTEEAALHTVKGLVKGLSPHFNMAGIETVMALRAQYGQQDKHLGAATDYINTSFLESALKDLEGQ